MTGFALLSYKDASSASDIVYSRTHIPSGVFLVLQQSFSFSIFFATAAAALAEGLGELAIGMGGTLEYLSELLGGHGHGRRGKRKQLHTVELKVRMDCEGCELKVKNALSSLKGVQSVEINRKQQKVTVSGYAEASKVLKKAQSTGKKAEIWPYVPYSLVSQPYVAGTYDKRAPAGYVRSAEPGYGYAPSQVSRQDDQLTDMFNDENTDSCSIM